MPQIYIILNFHNWTFKHKLDIFNLRYTCLTMGISKIKIRKIKGSGVYEYFLSRIQVLFLKIMKLVIVNCHDIYIYIYIM